MKNYNNANVSKRFSSAVRGFKEVMRLGEGDQMRLVSD